MRSNFAFIVVVFAQSALPQVVVRPTIVYNNLTGNSGATGAPGSYPLTTGTCDTESAGFRVLTDTINWPGNPFSDLPLDGTAVICAVENPLHDPTDPPFPGNPFPNDGCAAIVGRTSSTITITRDKFSLSENSTCTVGGKLLDPSDGYGPLSNLDLGWTVLLEYTGTDYAIPLPIGFGGNGEYPRMTFRGQLGPKGERVVLRYTYPFGDIESNAAIDGVDGTDIRDLIFINDADTDVPAFGGSFGVHLFNVTLDGWAMTFERGYGPNNGFVMYNCEIKNGRGTHGGFSTSVRTQDFPEDALLLANYIHDNSGDGFSMPGRSGVQGGSAFGRQLLLLYNLFANNTGFGIRASPGPPSGFMLPSDTELGGSHVFIHNTVYNSGLSSPSSSRRSGIAVSRVDQGYVIASNLSTHNTNYGIEGINGNATLPAYIGPDTLTGMARTVDGSAYYRNAIGNYLLSTPGNKDTTNVDPKYLSPANKNFCIGTRLLNKGWPLVTTNLGIGSASKTGVEPGACQLPGGAGNYAY
jgi:hypothetical protein